MTARDATQSTPGVSVVVPAYNSASTLPTTLDSVLAQEWQDLELIVVDDGSNDETRHLLRRYEQRYPDTVRVFSQDNRGPAAARNGGILGGRRPFVAFLDADDAWLPQKLRYQMATFERDPDLSFCATGYTYHDLRHPPQLAIIPKWDDAPESVLDRLLRSNCILTSTFIARRDALMTVGLFDVSLRFAEEYDLWLRIAEAGHRIGYVPEALTLYTRGASNLTSSFYRGGNDAYIPMLKKHFTEGALPQSIHARRRWYMSHRYLNNAIDFMDGDHNRKTMSALALAFCQRPASARPGWLLIFVKAFFRMARRAGGAGEVPEIGDTRRAGADQSHTG